MISNCSSKSVVKKASKYVTSYTGAVLQKCTPDIKVPVLTTVTQ